MCATGVVSGRPEKSSASPNVRSTRVIGHSIAVPPTSPSPWAAWPSPVENRAPSTGIGRYSVLPATSSLQSRFPPCQRGGIVECRPGSAGGMPSTPMNGRSATVWPNWLRAEPVPAASSQLMSQSRTAASLRPTRAFHAVGRAPATVKP